MPTSILDDVRQIAADVFGVPVDRILPATSPDTLPEWDSLHHVNLVIAIEQAFDVQFTPEQMVEMLNIGLVAMLVGELAPPEGSPRA